MNFTTSDVPANVVACSSFHVKQLLWFKNEKKLFINIILWRALYEKKSAHSSTLAERKVSIPFTS